MEPKPSVQREGHHTSNTSLSDHTITDDLETQRTQLREVNPLGNSNQCLGGINVAEAEQDFINLSRHLSNLSRTASRPDQKLGEENVDVEKLQTSTDGDVFDLESHLRGVTEEERNAGIKSKQLGVYWNDLTVSGLGGAKSFVATFPDAFISFLNIPGTIASILGLNKKGKEFDILTKFRGVAKPGEMVLVLGRPGSGCTTFLKVIANQRMGYSNIDGEVLYGKIDAHDFGKHFRGEAVYNQEDDVHHPTLTVGQTLAFALDTKTPAKRIPGMTPAQFKESVITLLLKMFNIEHTRNTVVGNQFVRGVSGGERKRVSIAEMMVTKATVCAWDNSSRGLDASTALDFAKGLRVMTDIYKTTTFVSLYQASESIYEQFDKVLVIDSGREVFYGPVGDARAHFESLGFAPKPRQTTPDYLTGCTDEFEREFAEGRDETNVPSTPLALEQAFQQSASWEKLNSEMAEYRETVAQEVDTHANFLAAVQESKRSGARPKSVYMIPYHQQIWALMQRQFLLKLQDKHTLAVSWLTSITIAIVLGTVYFDLPRTSAGAFTRGGVLFIALLFNAFQAFQELASTMMGRPVLNKHKAYAFHRPSALWLAQICVDMVFMASQIMVFCVIVYFMCNLVRDAGAFFTFFLLILSGWVAMTLFFRGIGCVCPDFDYAIKFASVVVTFFVLTSGYLIPEQAQGDWMSWIFWINALGLAFSSLMINEFKRITMRCTAENLIPSGDSYNDLEHQTCTLLGASPGSDLIDGGDYASLTFGYGRGDLWRNFGIIAAQIVFFLVANALLGEFFSYGAGGKTITFYQKENEERKRLNQALAAKVEARRKKTEKAAESELNIQSKSILTWEALKYDVPVPSGEIRLLKDIYGYVKPGQLTALMGASGAGKTTLLDVLAARKNIGVITGDILVDGKKPGTSFQRGTSYAEQLDVHEPTQTVREALRFSAYLRQPFDVPTAEKDAYVEEVISLLEMENIADAIIGDPTSGLAVEERKRVTIGVELAAKPELLLFLDEPTSGLDSQSAFNIVRFLRKLASAGQAILCTIHQPNASLFENFDRLLLLQRGGQCVYFGEIGTDADVLLDYFRRHGAVCPPNANPAEWMLDAIGAGQTPRIGDRDWADIWAESREFANVKEEIRMLKDERIKLVGAAPPVTEKEYATPLLFQIRTVMRRTNLSYWRSPNYGFTRFFNHVAIALLTGLAFLNLDNSRSSMQYRVFVIFQVTVLPALILAQIEPKYQFARMIFYREQSSKMYSQFAFALSMVIAELPYSILCAVAFFVCIYFPPGMNLEATRAGYQFFMVLVTELFSVTLGQAVAALTPNPFIASHFNPFLIIILGIFCGVTIPKPNIPKFWRYWLYELNPFTRLISGMVTTELHEMAVQCKDWEFNSFTAPAGETCESYAAEFMKNAPGYLRNASETVGDVCQYCAFKVGNEFFEPLGQSYSTRWRDLGILIAFTCSNLAILFAASRYLNFARR